MNKPKRIIAALLIGLATLIVTFANNLASAQIGPPSVNSLVISEFRLRGKNGVTDEFIEIYNNSNLSQTVVTEPGSKGYALVASDTITRCVIPRGQIIPARGHFLCVNAAGYSLASYPSGSATTATGDDAYFTDIPDNAGIALFNTSITSHFNLSNRIDAVGSIGEGNSLYKEGAGYPALMPYSVDGSFFRDTCGKIPSSPPPAPCPYAGSVKDTNNNAADFLFEDTNGTAAGMGQRLGAPGPENSTSPGTLAGSPGLVRTLLDLSAGLSFSPNRRRDETSEPWNNSTFGTVSFNRTFTNHSSVSITRLRFRVINLTTFPSPSGTADLRPRSTVDHFEVTTSGLRLVRGTTLEEPPGQPNGGGINSSLSAASVTQVAYLKPGTSINLQFLFGVQQMGNYRFAIMVETLPFTGGDTVWYLSGNTQSASDLEP